MLVLFTDCGIGLAKILLRNFLFRVMHDTWWSVVSLFPCNVFLWSGTRVNLVPYEELKSSLLLHFIGKL